MADVFDFSGKFPCRVDRNIRIVSIYIHSQINSCVGNHSSDCSQTDDTQFLSFDFTSGKLFFLFFCQFSDIFIFFLLFNPFDTAHDITGSQKHSGNNHFFHTVSVGTRCIEYNNTLLCTFFKRDIINSGTGSCHCFYICRQFHVMHSCTSHQNGISLCQIIGLYIIVGQTVKTNLGNRI